MSLTPFGSRYDDPFFGDDYDSEFGFSLWDDPLDGYYDDFATELESIEYQIDQCYPSYEDISYQTELAWKEYEDDHRPNPVVDSPTPPTATEALEERLARTAWLHTPAHRHINPKRNAQKGRRYMIVVDHGTAIERKQITANRRERLRKARQNRHTKHYTPDWKLRARRNEQATWGAAQDDLAALADHGIVHGLFYIALTEGCTDQRCCPVDLGDAWYYKFGDDAHFLRNPYDDDDYLPGGPRISAGFGDMSFDW